MDVWPQYALNRTVSDQYIKQSQQDWGPKSFRYLNVWQTDKSFKDCVKNDWENQNLERNEIWKMKEKLKSLILE